MRQDLSIRLIGALFCLLLLCSIVEAGDVKPVGDVVPFHRPACVSFRNLKTEKPELFNNCDKPLTIGLASFHGDKYLGTRIFHVWRKTKRPFTFVGDIVAVAWVKDWASEGIDDGSQFLSFSQVQDGPDQLWYVKNTSPRQYNAFALKIFYNYYPIANAVHYVLAPNETAPVFNFHNDVGRVMIEWSRLDPE
jgi:hypothetical protein